MQQPIVRQDVYEPSLDVTIGGRSVEGVSVRMERALPDPVKGDALRSASGNVIVSEGPDVVDTVVTPWDPNSQWPPVPQTPVSVKMNTGAGQVEILGGGLVTDVHAGSDSRQVDVGVADAYESLNRPISWGNLADAMPALTEATTQRYVSLHASAVTDMILRHCGWYCTPPLLGYSVLSVPAMGTMWPEVGSLLTSIAQSAGNSYPTMFTEPWGKGVSDVTASYQRAAEYTVKDRGRVEMTAIAGRRNGGTMSMVARTATYRRYRLSWTDSTASLWVTNAAGDYVLAASLPRQVGSFLYATIEYVSDTSVLAWLQVDSASTSATVAVHPDLNTLPLTVFEISGNGVGGGFQVALPSVSRALSTWKPNAVIYDRASSVNALQVLKAVEGEDCARLMLEQCEAQAATYWIDETGVLRWWDLARLESRAPVATITSDDDIRSDDRFEWSFDRSSLRSRAVVNWQEPLIEGGWRTNVDLWQGSGSTVEMTDADNPKQEWIPVPSDEVWIMPDLSPARVGGSGADMNDFNYGFQSHYGGVVRLSEGSESWVQNHGSFLVTLERVNDSAFKMFTTWTGTQQAYQRTTQGADSPSLWGMRRDFDLPIIRGKKKYTFGDRNAISSQTGPQRAPEHVVDAGWWIQNEAQAQYTADYYGARVTVPQPMLGNVGLVPIPGLQLGDMVEVAENVVSRLRVRGVIMWDDRTVGRRMSHAIALRPTLVSRTGVTWEEWGAAMNGRTWQTWGGQQQPKTWEQWGQDPLAGEET